MAFMDRLKHAWNAFSANSSRTQSSYSMSTSSPMRKPSSYITGDRSIVTNVLTRTAVDVAMIDFMHVDTDINGRFITERDSGLNYCITREANIDQSGFSFKKDIVDTLFSEGVAAVVPVDTTYDPKETGGYDIKTMRVGTVSAWQKDSVTVSLYNERKGKREQVTLPKRDVAIIQNPLYSIMNEPNSTLQRLMDKLKLLDISDASINSQKLDMIIQLPYVIKSEQRRKLAEDRRRDIEFQLKSSELGIAYTDGTEKIVQLNRPIDNNLQATIEYLTDQLYSQLGITKELLAGSASEEEINNYYRRTVEPVAKAIAEEFERKFLTKTARTQGQKVLYLRSQFDFVTTSSIGDLADKLIRNEVLTSNEIRSILGFKPSVDPRADELRNKNMPIEDTGSSLDPPIEEEMADDEDFKMERNF